MVTRGNSDMSDLPVLASSHIRDHSGCGIIKLVVAHSTKTAHKEMEKEKNPQTNQRLSEKLSKEEIRIYTEAFLEYDLNGDGAISFEEFVQSDFAKLGFKEDEKDMILRITFDELDQNKDGKITLDEHLRVCGKLDRDVRIAAETRRIFQTLDLDLDGKISEEEFLIYIREKGSSLTPAQVHTIFKAVDKDKDGKLSAKEFFEAVM